MFGAVATGASAVLALSAPAAAAPGVGVFATPTCNTTYVYNMRRVPSAGTNITCNMVRGNVSDAVGQLQHTLNVCYGKSLATDGVFGGGTQTALKQVQSAIGVSADGVYGPNTRNAMKFIHADMHPLTCYRL
ncbi:peptidoglycan-binding domain-containing protein [Micromonospora sp. URMC 105]|uniref:peptidoglycan-binding domain-containing protein n=1 Tax=Micromonospora sp. URMC 105 TaxID=3423413 RepID=UPI003F1DE437